MARLCIALAVFLVLAPASAGGRPLQTAVSDPTTDLGVERIAGAGARAVYVLLNWRSVAPATLEPGFNRDDPFDPAYRWRAYDERLQRIVRRGLEPLVGIYAAPRWAEGSGPRLPGAVDGSVRPSPTELRRFARAAALRYSGRFRDFPRVRLWQLWTEQNLYFHLSPQMQGRRAVAPIWYRGMLNEFADAVHAVDRRNLVITGGLAPFTTHTGDRRLWGTAPLRFMRVMLCIGKNLKPICSARSKFDVWSHHPFTSGGPTHHAGLPDDVSLGDLPEMKRLLDAAVRSGHIASRAPVRFWVTEFSWDTSPPDPLGVPARLHARWVAEALYRMWAAGVSLVTWTQLRDDLMSESYLQSGLYFRGTTPPRDRPKPALKAFRFPFVALPTGGRATIWGRTPTSRPEAVLIQRRTPRGWVRLTLLQANRYGIFRVRLRAPLRASLRARILSSGEFSRPFRVVRTRDRPMFAFGTLPRG